MGVRGFGPYIAKSALLFWGNQLGHSSSEALASMRLVPMANGPTVALAKIVGVDNSFVQRPVVATVVLNDVMRALEADWGRGKRTLFMHFIDATGSQACPEISHRGGITLTITNLVVVVYSIKFRDEILNFFVVIYMVVLEVSKNNCKTHAF
jgi:hypothetical protein